MSNVCAFWRKFACTKGTHCQFKHSGPGGLANNNKNGFQQQPAKPYANTTTNSGPYANTTTNSGPTTATTPSPAELE
jgi:hypothetical protein